MPPQDLMKNVVGSTNSIVASVIWGAIGSGFAIYGWKQKEMIPLFGGIALVGGSYFFTTSALWMSVFSVATLVAIFWLKKHY